MNKTVKTTEYLEQLRSPNKIFVFLGALLGVTGGILTGVAVRSLTGGPIVSDGGAVVFYATFAASSIITLFVMLNYLIMNVRVSTSGVSVKIGMRSVLIGVEEVIDVRIAETKSRVDRALGRDGRNTTQIWTVLGVGSGVEITLARNDGPEIWFIASLEPEAFRKSITSLVTPPSIDESSRG